MRDENRASLSAGKPLSQFDSSRPQKAEPEWPTKGTWFRSDIDLREPEGSELTNALIARIASVEGRARALKPLDASNRSKLVRQIAANALACHTHRVRPYVAYMARAASYEMEPCWLNGAAMRRTVGLLERCGLLDAWPGIKGRASSMYAPSRALLKLFGEHNVHKGSLTENMPSGRLIRLRRSNRNGPELSFSETEETEAWITQLQAYNHFVGLHDLAVEISDREVCEWIRKLNERDSLKGLPFRYPELFRTNLFRTFNNGSFEHGGRLYGAWWTNAPRSIRRSIRINGTDTVEHDYSGHAIRMLYHERGLNYQDDPYLIEPLWDFAAEKGLAEKHFREPIKALTQALINGRCDGRPERARIANFTFKPFARPKIREMIEAKHSGIADAFATGAGIRLQRKDSDLALSIITNLMDQGVLALPIHDSFLVASNDEDKLLIEMESCYRNSFGFDPLIKKEL
jgi:hypothetical protein